jgi:hypothetical protein
VLGSKESQLLMDVVKTVGIIHQELMEFREVTLRTLSEVKAALEEVKANPTPQHR